MSEPDKTTEEKKTVDGNSVKKPKVKKPRQRRKQTNNSETTKEDKDTPTKNVPKSQGNTKQNNKKKVLGDSKDVKQTVDKLPKKKSQQEAHVTFPEKPVNKLTIRKLPPNLDETMFIDTVCKALPKFKEMIQGYYYVKGHLPQSQFEEPVLSRCYINCIDEESMMCIGKGIKTIRFTTVDDESDEIFDEEMEVYEQVVEKSFYQKLEENREQQLFEQNGTIKNDRHYIQFLKFLEKEDKSMPKNIFEYVDEIQEKKLKKNAQKKAAKGDDSNKKDNDIKKAEKKKADTEKAKKKKADKKKAEKKNGKKPAVASQSQSPSPSPSPSQSAKKKKAKPVV